MAVTSYWYTSAFVYAFQDAATYPGPIDWENNTFKIALLSSSYTPDQDNHVRFDTAAVSDYEVSATGYTEGGATLSSTSVSMASGVVSLSAADVAWTNSTITARYAVIYRVGDLESGEHHLLIGYIDFGEDKSSSSGTFTIDFDDGVVFTITV
jgi:hypothetical protein